MEKNKISKSSRLKYLLLLLMILTYLNCKRDVNPVGHSAENWVVDSTLIGEIISKVDSNHIRNTIQTLQDFGTRFAYSPKCYEAAQWIKSQLKSYGYVVEDQPFQHYLFNDIFFANESNAWIVGNYGLILHSGDGGATWQKQESPTITQLKKVFFIDQFNGWAGSDSLLLKTMNSGMTWEVVNGVSGSELFDIFFLNLSLGWVCTNTALYYTSDGGNAWSIIYSGKCRGAYFFSESIGFLCLKNSLLKTTDAGLNWIEIFTSSSSSTNFEDVFFYNNLLGMVISEDGDIYISKDGGGNWAWQIIEGQPELIGCNIVNPDFYVVHSSYDIYNSYDGGFTWKSTMTDNLKGDIYSIDFKNEQNGFAVGPSFFQTSNDSGITWNEFPFQGMEGSVLQHNIKATINGKINSDDRIILGAHYDAISYSGSFLSAPGANDNASGTAGVLEIARVLSEYNFDASLDFILFDHEEPNPTLLGSKYASAKSVNENESIVEMIDFDMISYCPDNVYDVLIHTPDSNHRADFISRASTYPGIIIYEEDRWVSDEKSYGENGFPAFGISEYTYPSVRDYPWYHSSEDKIDKLNIGFTTEVVKFTMNGICLKNLPVTTK